MPSTHLILCHPLLLLPPIPPSIRVFSNESTLHMRWPKYWSFSFSVIASKEHPGLISFRMDWLDLTLLNNIVHSKCLQSRRQCSLHLEIKRVFCHLVQSVHEVNRCQKCQGIFWYGISSSMNLTDGFLHSVFCMALFYIWLSFHIRRFKVE